MALVERNPLANQGRETRVQSMGEGDSLDEGMATHSILLPGESCEERSLAGGSPKGYKESDTTEVTSVQLNSVTQSCPTLCDPINCSMPGFRVHHQLPEFTQTHVHQVIDVGKIHIS